MMVPMDRQTATDAIVDLAGVAKRYLGDGPYAVSDLGLTVERGEILCLLGPSGCGKTTLLRLLAGFERPDAGEVRLAGELVASPTRSVPPERRRIGFVFQDFALFPHLNVTDNVAFGLRGTRAQRRARAADVLDLVGLSVFAARMPHQLSGGQQQRVALARALAPEPHILLLDEPFTNLDASLRGATRDEVRSVLKRSGTTAILVTHDQDEALSFGDRIAVMRFGRIEQIGKPEDVYLRPVTPFVASFVGRTNLLRGVADGGVVRTALGAVTLVNEAAGQVVVSLRPDQLQLVVGERPARALVKATVVRREFRGHVVTYEAHVGMAPHVGERLLVDDRPESGVGVGDEAWVVVTGAGVSLA